MKYKPKRVATYLAFNSALAFLLYLTATGNIGAERVFTFIVWMLAIIYIWGVGQISELKGIPNRSVPRWVSAPFAFASLGVLVYCGIWAAAIGYFLAYMAERVIIFEGERREKE
jgi:nitrate reductase NapE component